MHQCIKFNLFWNDNLHVSDGLSVHHQEFETVHTATSRTHQQAVSSIGLTNVCCHMYSLELRMMDGKTV